MNSHRIISGLVVLSLMVAFVMSAGSAMANVCKSTDDCQDKIKEYEEKLGATREQKSSLSSQIQLINTKVNLAQARLQKTELDIETAQKEIDDLEGKIDRLNESLDHLTSILLEKIVEGYKRRHVGFLEFFLTPETTTLENQLKYIQAAQESDRVLALRTQQVKVNFTDQKDLREVKVQELEELETQLEIQKVELNNQITQKEALLEQTKSDEVKYQQLLSQALSEFNAINRAITTGKKVGPVKKGDAIALVGNTGYPYCSTGAHLHFEIRKEGSWVDPGGYVGDGKDWKMPLSEPVVMTQSYGVTPYSWRYSYSGGIHTGWDMISKSSDVIRATADGTLYSSTQNCSGAIINIRYIDHGDEKQSFYLHVQ